MSDLTIVVNGDRRVVGSTTTVAELVAGEVATPAGVAVALNDELVPRSTWTATALTDGDRVELLRAAPGG
jgi:sulfur carrier protein